MNGLPKFVRQRAASTPARATSAHAGDPAWQQSSGEHPDANLLGAYAEGGLTQRERTQVLAHLGACAACREIVGLALPEIAAALPAASPAKQLWRWPVLRWAGVAAAVVVVAAAVVVQRSYVYHSQPAAMNTAAPAQERVAAPAEAQKAETKPGDSAMTAPSAAPSPMSKPAEIAAAPGAASAPMKLAQPRMVVPSAPPNTAKQMERKDDKREMTANDAVAFKLDKKAEQASAPANQNASELRDSGQGVNVTAAAGPQAAPSTAGKVLGGDLQQQASQQQQTSSQQQQRASAQQQQRASAQQQQQQVNAPASQGLANSNGQLGRMQAQGTTAEQGRPSSAAESVSVVAPSTKRAKTASAPLANAVLVGAGPRWRVSSEGAVERSTDAGRTWQLMPVAAEAPAFRAVATVDGNVWVGGAGGALYHSADGGRTWRRVPVIAEDMVLAADIARVEFADAHHGSVTTTAGETWSTSDAGATWRIQPRSMRPR